ncbi:MAG: hypothetical protein JSS87_02180 [Acidobacteria bacterium]|nr:hypothetical protein [Acidobacteriota bacterium]
MKKAVYSYNGDGGSIRAGQLDGNCNIASWREYVRFGGRVLSELSQDAGQSAPGWTDYIYANGKRIARIEGVEKRAHLHAVLAPGGSSGRAALASLPLTAFLRFRDRAAYR